MRGEKGSLLKGFIYKLYHASWGKFTRSKKTRKMEKNKKSRYSN